MLNEEGKKTAILTVKRIVSVISIFLIIALVVFVFSASNPFQIPSTGNVTGVSTVGLEAYWDSNRITPVTLIKWGVVSPGGNKSVYLYLYNPSNVKVNIYVHGDNWQPSAMANYTTFKLTFNGPLFPNTAKLAKLTMIVSPTIRGIIEFNFNVVLTAMET